MGRKSHGSDFSGGQSACLVALITLFLIGAVVGSFFAANLGPGGQGLVAGFFGSAAGRGIWPLLQMAALESALLLFVFASAFFPLGLAVAPLVMGIKGFVLSLLVSAFVKTLGARGYAAALALIVPGGFTSVACMVLVGLQAMTLAARRVGRAGRGRMPTDWAYFFTGGIAWALIGLATALSCYITPLMGRAAGL